MGLNDEAEKVRQAVEWVARRAVFRLVEGEVDEDLWGSYPEIGEHDWLKVEEKVKAIIDPLNPTDEQFDAAYEFLERRADHD